MIWIFLRQLSDKYGSAKRNHCREQGCGIVLDTGKQHAVFKGEDVASMLGTSVKMCDCIIFQADGTLVLVELKNQLYHASDIVEKFSNTVRMIASMMSLASRREFTIYLVLLHKKRTTRSVRDGIAKGIQRNNNQYNIIRSNCGSSLNCILDNHVGTRIVLNASP